MVTPGGVVTTIAGSGSGSSTDGIGTAASFHAPTGIALDGADNLYISDHETHSVRKVSAGNWVTTLAGGTAGYNDADHLYAAFSAPVSLAVGLQGQLVVSDKNNHRLRKIDAKLVPREALPPAPPSPPMPTSPPLPPFSPPPPSSPPPPR